MSQSFSAALENAKLLYQAEQVQDYSGVFRFAWNRRRSRPANRTQASYQEYLKLTRDRYSGGVASDLAQAESQLYAVQTQLMDMEFSAFNSNMPSRS